MTVEKQGCGKSHPDPKFDPNVFSTFIFPLTGPPFPKRNMRYLRAKVVQPGTDTSD